MSAASLPHFSCCSVLEGFCCPSPGLPCPHRLRKAGPGAAGSCAGHRIAYRRVKRCCRRPECASDVPALRCCGVALTPRQHLVHGQSAYVQHLNRIILHIPGIQLPRPTLTCLILEQTAEKVFGRRAKTRHVGTHEGPWGAFSLCWTRRQGVNAFSKHTVRAAERSASSRGSHHEQLQAPIHGLASYAGT